MILSDQTRAYLREELRRHRGLLFGASVAVSAALGSAGPDIVAVIHRVLS